MLMSAALGKKTMPNAFRRRAAVKPRRVIDACVIIAAPVEQNAACSDYLTGLGVQHHGFLTHALVGEVVQGMYKHTETALRLSLYRYFDNLLLAGLLSILPVREISHEEVARLRANLPFLSLADAVHLAETLEQGFLEFVTIDRELTNRRNRERLSELGLKIVVPRGSSPEPIRW